jgi:hypothetical protein
MKKVGLKDQFYVSLQELWGKEFGIAREAMDMQEVVEIFKLQPKTKFVRSLRETDILASVCRNRFAIVSIIFRNQFNNVIYWLYISRSWDILRKCCIIWLRIIKILMTIVTTWLVERNGR